MVKVTNKWLKLQIEVICYIVTSIIKEQNKLLITIMHNCMT
jgi:hypothetical protein